MTYVLHLDRYHLGDPLFLTGFARDVQALGAPCLLVHGAGEQAERALEAQGHFPSFEDGVLRVETAEERRVVVRAARELNRHIVHTLNDAGVAAVGLEASGRGLLRRSGEEIFSGKVDWLRDLVKQGAVAVIAAILAGPEGEAFESNGGAIAGALAVALSDSGAPATVFFLTKNGQDGLYLGDQPLDQAELEAAPESALPEMDAVRAACVAQAEVIVTSRSGLRAKPVRGTRLRCTPPKKTP